MRSSFIITAAILVAVSLSSTPATALELEAGLVLGANSSRLSQPRDVEGEPRDLGDQLEVISDCAGARSNERRQQLVVVAAAVTDSVAVRIDGKCWYQGKLHV